MVQVLVTSVSGYSIYQMDYGVQYIVQYSTVQCKPIAVQYIVTVNVTTRLLLLVSLKEKKF